MSIPGFPDNIGERKAKETFTHPTKRREAMIPFAKKRRNRRQIE